MDGYFNVWMFNDFVCECCYKLTMNFEQNSTYFQHIFLWSLYDSASHSNYPKELAEIQQKRHLFYYGVNYEKYYNYMHINLGKR